MLCFLGDEDDADTGDDSILDVNNDQMFDDTIFTEYNDQNLSVMSNKMTKKWRKKWEKEDLRKRTFGAETIDRSSSSHVFTNSETTNLRLFSRFFFAKSFSFRSKMSI